MKRITDSQSGPGFLSHDVSANVNTPEAAGFLAFVVVDLKGVSRLKSLRELAWEPP